MYNFCLIFFVQVLLIGSIPLCNGYDMSLYVSVLGFCIHFAYVPPRGLYQHITYHIQFDCFSYVQLGPLAAVNTQERLHWLQTKNKNANSWKWLIMSRRNFLLLLIRRSESAIMQFVWNSVNLWKIARGEITAWMLTTPMSFARVSSKAMMM